MSKVSMYRIEHVWERAGSRYSSTFRVGVYGTGHCVGGHGPNCPAPHCDVPDWAWRQAPVTSWFFGFRSIEQLLEWFLPHECTKMAHSGELVVRHYRGPKVIFGGRQMVMFDEDVELVEELALDAISGGAMLYDHPRYDSYLAGRRAGPPQELAFRQGRGRATGEVGSGAVRSRAGVDGLGGGALALRRQAQAEV